MWVIVFCILCCRPSTTPTDFLQLKKNHGMEEARARDLFYALWVPDLFMKVCSESFFLNKRCKDP